LHVYLQICAGGRSRRCLAPPSQPRRGSWSPTGRSPGSGSLPLGSFPRLVASVDLAHGSPVTVTGSRRILTGFPFQLSLSHLSALFTCRGAWPASPPPKG